MRSLLCVLTLVSLLSGTWSCDCQMMDSVAELVVSKAGDTVRLACDKPTTWPADVTVTWTKYPDEKLSKASEVLTKDKRYSVLSEREGDFSLQITNVSDDGKYYCKFAQGNDDPTFILKVYRVQVERTNSQNYEALALVIPLGRRSADLPVRRVSPTRRNVTTATGAGNWTRTTGDYSGQRNQSKLATRATRTTARIVRLTTVGRPKNASRTSWNSSSGNGTRQWSGDKQISNYTVSSATNSSRSTRFASAKVTTTAAKVSPARTSKPARLVKEVTKRGNAAQTTSKTSRRLPSTRGPTTPRPKVVRRTRPSALITTAPSATNE